MKLEPKNPALLDKLQLFVVARPETRARFDLRPFDIEVRHAPHPLETPSTSFFELLKRLDEVTFGPEGMPMPRWVFLNGAIMTGGIVGFGVPAAHAPDRARELLQVPDGYQGLVPYAVFIAIPTHETDVWFGHNLASIAGQLPDEELGGLGSLTKAVALKMFRTRLQIGATQWPSRALFVHTRLGPLELLTASTPSHGEKDTLTYRAIITDDALKNLGRDPSAYISYPEPDEWVASGDRARQSQLQDEIEAGHRFAIVGRPQPDGDEVRIPIARLGD